MKNIIKILLIVSIIGLAIPPLHAQQVVTDTLILEPYQDGIVAITDSEGSVEYNLITPSIGRKSDYYTSDPQSYGVFRSYFEYDLSPLDDISGLDIQTVKVDYWTDAGSYEFMITQPSNWSNDLEEQWKEIGEGSVFESGIEYGQGIFSSSVIRYELESMLSSNEDSMLLGALSEDESANNSKSNFTTDGIILIVIYERPAESISAVVRNDFHGNDGGNIGIGIDDSATSYNSPKSISANENQTLNLAAYDGFTGYGYDWVFNDTEASDNKSEWRWQKGLNTKFFGEGNQAPTYGKLKAEDDGATFAAIHRALCKVDLTIQTDYWGSWTEYADTQVVRNASSKYKPSDVTKDGHSLEIVGWTDDPSASIPRTISPDDHVTYSAVYKGELLTDQQQAWNATHQKIVQTPADGWKHMVYESGGHIRYLAKAPGGDWNFVRGGGDRTHLDAGGGSSPSIDYHFDEKRIFIAWQAGNGDIKIRSFYYVNGFDRYVWYEPSAKTVTQSAPDNAQPNLAWSGGDHGLVIWKQDNTLSYQLYEFLPTQPSSTPSLNPLGSGTIDGSSNAENAALTAEKDASPSQANFYIAWEETEYVGPPNFMERHIKYNYLVHYPDYGSYQGQESTASSGRGLRGRRISITATDQLWIAWQSDHGSEDGGNFWDPWETKASLYNHQTSTIRTFDHHVRSVGLSKHYDQQQVYLGWSQIYEDDSWNDFNKFVSSSDFLTTKLFNTKGNRVQMHDGSGPGDIRLMSFYPDVPSGDPKYWEYSNTLNNLMKRPATPDMQMSRGIALSKDRSTAYFAIGNVSTDGNRIAFNSADAPVQTDFPPDLKQITEDTAAGEPSTATLSKLKPALLSEPFELRPSTSINLSEYVGFVDSAHTAGLYSKDRYITFKTELIDAQTQRVLGTPREVTFGRGRPVKRDTSRWNIGVQGVREGRARIRISIATNVEGLKPVITSDFAKRDGQNQEAARRVDGTLTVNGSPVEEYRLGKNYPNPFNPSTKISYQLPKPSEVRLSVYNVSGRLVKTLVNGNQEAGRYTVTFNGANLASGVYFYRLEAAEFSSTKKLFLIK